MRAPVIWFAVATAALVVTAPASAQDPPTPNDSAASQYVEAIPSADGTKPTGVNASSSRPTLPAAISERLRREGGTDAATLERIATSPARGAPPLGRTRIRSVPRPPTETAASAIRGALTSVASSGGGGGRLAVLALALAAITGATMVAAARHAAPARKR